MTRDRSKDNRGWFELSVKTMARVPDGIYTETARDPLAEGGKTPVVVRLRTRLRKGKLQGSFFLLKEHMDGAHTPSLVGFMPQLRELQGAAEPCERQNIIRDLNERTVKSTGEGLE